jgi:hypothetical protein
LDLCGFASTLFEISLGRDKIRDIVGVERGEYLGEVFDKSGEGEVGVKLNIRISGERGIDESFDDILLVSCTVEISTGRLTGVSGEVLKK